MLLSRHEDNPRLYNHSALSWTPEGLQYLAKLQRLSGVRRKRLYEGQWVAAEGSAYFARAHLAHEAIRRELDLALERVSQGHYEVDAGGAITSIDEGWRSSAAKLLVDGKPERARRILESLSDPTTVPDKVSTGKAALGAWQKPKPAR
jgi:hypothetical protein